jgi:hypothetical protein
VTPPNDLTVVADVSGILSEVEVHFVSPFGPSTARASPGMTARFDIGLNTLGAAWI